MQPCMLVTFDEELRALPVRVGQAVDVVRHYRHHPNDVRSWREGGVGHKRVNPCPGHNGGIRHSEERSGFLTCFKIAILLYFEESRDRVPGVEEDSATVSTLLTKLKFSLTQLTFLNTKDQEANI